ncbi:MAG: hypothetical protein ACPGEF_00995 [Endozoicomonas sp.]
MTIFTIFIVILAILISGSLLFWTLRLGIGPVPTSPSVQINIHEILPEKVSGNVVELGCGWGQLLKIIKLKYPSHNIQAYERSTFPALFCQLMTSITIKKKDFFNADFSDTGLIVCYLYPGAMDRIERDIIPKLPSGCWIVTHTFSLRKRNPVKLIKSNDMYRTPIYLYKV